MKTHTLNRMMALMLILLLLQSACRKNHSNYPPEVNIVGWTERTHTSMNFEISATYYTSSEPVNCGLCWSTEPDPDLSDKVAMLTTSNPYFELTASGLTPNTSYYFRAFAIGESTTNYSRSFRCTTLGEPITDVEGNSYYTIRIGDQVWMAEDLRCRHFNNGDVIAEAVNNSDWNGISPSFCSYPYTYDSTVGYIYNHYAAIDPRGLAPEGWRIPGKEDWEELFGWLTARGFVSSEIMLTSVLDYGSAAKVADSLGFSGRYCGYRTYDGIFYSYLSAAAWWTSTLADSTSAWRVMMRSTSTAPDYSYATRKNGYYIRCIRE